MDKSAQTRHNEYQQSYYEDRSPAGNHRVAVQSTPYVQNHLEKFLNFSAIVPGQRVLDVGCGMGKYTIPLAERGISIDGLDLSQVLLDALMAEAKGRAQIQTHCGDLLDPDPALFGRYDHVIGFFMLHHLFDLQRAFEQVGRLLKPGGKASFLEPNPYCPLFPVQITLMPGMSWQAEKGIYNLTPGAVADSFQGAGFRECRIERFGILPPFVRNRRGAAAFETAFERVGLFDRICAFQLISAHI